MSAILDPPCVVPTRLRLFGGVDVAWRGRRNPPWAYVKLPAMLVVLGDAGHRAVRREWLAALLWPEGDAGSLRRALYDLKRQLRSGRSGAELVECGREAVRLAELLPSDVDLLDAAWRARDRLDADRAERALEAWAGDFAAGLEVRGCDEFDFWLQQARSRWQQRGLELSLALAQWHLRAGHADRALEVARRAVERVPDAEAARALLWRCFVGGGARLAAVDDWRRYEDLLRAQGMQPSGSLRRQAAELGLVPDSTGAPAPDGERSLADALGLALRGGGGDIEQLLRRAESQLLVADRHTTSVLLLRRALMLRLMHAPWHDEMVRLAGRAEALLCQPLADADRLDLIQPLAMWHGWMGRGMHGEALLRGVGDVDDERLPAATRVRHAMTLALCHSCSTGDPERSIRAARRGLKVARAGAVPGCSAALAMLVANAALNRGAAGDAAVSRRALAQALSDGPLQRFDLVNHHQLSAQWQLQHGAPARALAEAEQGVRMADAVPFPLQRLSCVLLTVCARLLMGEPPGTLAGPLADAVSSARRIGSQGYLMNALFLAAVLARRKGDALRAAQALDEALAIARACGAQRFRKIPSPLLAEAGGTAAHARHSAGWTANAATN
jgi:DNA-binding SARP family transcriptional activator